MAVQYWVGDFFIDVTRNQITQKTHSQTIPPKALAVLTYLAKNANRVVSQDELLSEVWPNTVVTPNTLQRSIAQLRKALGADTQCPSYIKTHSKQGYSLEVEVRWLENAEAASLVTPHMATSVEVNDVADADVVEEHEITASLSATKLNPPRHALKLVLLLAGVMIIGVAARYLAPTAPINLSVGELRLLTSSDNKEYASIYSPDGEYVVFHRYPNEFCSNNIWAKNTKTQQEFQLTKSLGSYGSHSFSKDGNKLVFIKTSGCNKPINQKQCYQLMSLDFNKALQAPQVPNVMMECKNSTIRSPKWLNNNDIALLQRSSARWQLITYSAAEDKSAVIYSIDDGNLVDYDYSATDDLIALTSIHSDGRNYLEILKPDGQRISSHAIKYPQEIANFRLINPNFSPLNNQLFFSTGRQLFTMSYEGQVTNVSLPLDEPMGSPIFHPDGDRMLVIKGHYDSDIVSLPLAELTQAPAANITGAQLTVLDRSTLGEDSAIFQPNNALIAYISERTGDAQLWLTNGKGPQQLSHFPMDNSIRGMEWAADGSSVLVNVNHALQQVFLDGRVQPLTFASPIDRLYQWDSTNQTALAKIRVQGLLKLAELNLSQAEIRFVKETPVHWALKSENGVVVYTDQMDRYWQSGPVEDRLIEPLENQGSHKRFVIKDNVIYGINESSQLWTYALDEEKFEIIGQLPSHIDHITDINQTHLLLTARVAARKDVAEISLRN